MNTAKFEKLLVRIGACESARNWAKGKSLKEVWDTCERGDWLLWLAGRMSGKKGWPNRKAVVLAACAVAETALVHVPAGDLRPLTAIQTARKWAVGQATLSEVRKAAAAPATAAFAAFAPATAAFAPYAAAFAAFAAYAAYASRLESASAASLKVSAEIVRRHLTVPVSEE